MSPTARKLELVLLGFCIVLNASFSTPIYPGVVTGPRESPGSGISRQWNDNRSERKNTQNVNADVATKLATDISTFQDIDNVNKLANEVRTTRVNTPRDAGSTQLLDERTTRVNTPRDSGSTQLLDERTTRVNTPRDSGSTQLLDERTTRVNTPRVAGSSRSFDDLGNVITKTETVNVVTKGAFKTPEPEVKTTVVNSYEQVNDTTPYTNETFIDNIPDPVDNYMNQIYLYSPDMFALKEEVTNMIQDSLSYSGQFLPLETLNTIPIRTYFNTNDNGDRFTTVTYVVSHNGQFVHHDTVSSIITKPEVKKHLHKHLSRKGWTECLVDPDRTSWVHKNVVAVVVPTCVCFVIIVFIMLFACRRRSVNSSSNKKKVPKFATPGSEKCGPPPSYDASCGINNPVYDEATGNAMP